MRLITLVSWGRLVAPSSVASWSFLFRSRSCLASVRFFTWWYWSDVGLRNWKASKIWIFSPSLSSIFWMQKLIWVELNLALYYRWNSWRRGWSDHFLYERQAFLGVIDVDFRPLALIWLLIANSCIYLRIQATLKPIMILLFNRCIIGERIVIYQQLGVELLTGFLNLRVIFLIFVSFALASSHLKLRNIRWVPRFHSNRPTLFLCFIAILVRCN